MRQLPVLLSIPHGGTKIPIEGESEIKITKREIFEDGDAYVREIYDLGPKVKKVISSDIARAFVDLNRAPDDLPPKNPDGVVKSMTCYRRPVYVSKDGPGEELGAKLIKSYYVPYHEEIRRAIKSRGPNLD